MDIILLLIPIGLIFIALFLGIFIWSVRSGQFDDLDSPASKILFDDDQDMIPEEARPLKHKSKQDD